MFIKMGVTDVFSNNADLSGVAEGDRFMVSKVSVRAGIVIKRFACPACMLVLSSQID